MSKDNLPDNYREEHMTKREALVRREEVEEMLGELVEDIRELEDKLEEQLDILFSIDSPDSDTYAFQEEICDDIKYEIAEKEKEFELLEEFLDEIKFELGEF